jgi:phospholipid/cholesterol/gamma-HCH transport system substrate-binding protein
MDDAFYTAAYTSVTNLQNASADLKGLTDQAQQFLTQTRSILDDIQQGRGTLGKLSKDETLYKEGATAMTNLREILEKMNKGQGTVGGLINDDAFLKNAKLSLQKLDKATDGLEDQGPLSILGLVIGSLF